MAYINPDWISDEHFEYLDDNFDLTKYDDYVDKKINAICLKEGVPVSQIPTDETTGFVESIPLQLYGVALYKRSVFSGYWGKHNGSNDLYWAKFQEAKQEIAEAKDDITKETILDNTEESTEDELSKSNTIKQNPYY